jgi:hypothetical protein
MECTERLLRITANGVIPWNMLKEGREAVI